jgi:hypothetical protein
MVNGTHFGQVNCPQEVSLAIKSGHTPSFAAWSASQPRGPSIVTLVADDRDQFLQLLAQLSAKPEQPTLFLRRRNKSLRQLGPQDPVRILEVCDLPGKFRAS